MAKISALELLRTTDVGEREKFRIALTKLKKVREESKDLFQWIAAMSEIPAFRLEVRPIVQAPIGIYANFRDLREAFRKGKEETRVVLAQAQTQGLAIVGPALSLARVLAQYSFWAYIGKQLKDTAVAISRAVGEGTPPVPVIEALTEQTVAEGELVAQEATKKVSAAVKWLAIAGVGLVALMALKVIKK